MKRTLFIAFVLILLFPTIAVAEETIRYSSTQIIENAKDIDNQHIKYRGEIIGDPLVRGEFVWLSVNDGTSALSVHVSAELLPDSLIFGKYGIRGDILTFTGCFHRACAEHGGDLDIHVESLELNENGYTVPIQRSARFTIATGMVSAFAIASLFYVKKIHASIP